MSGPDDGPVPTAPPRPFSIRPIVSESVRTFRRDWRALLVLAALIEVPLVLAEVVLHATPSLRGIVEDDSFVGIVALLTVYGSLSHHFLAGLLERVVGAERHGHERPTVHAVIRHLPWHRLVVADVVLTLLIVVGLGLLVVPGILVATWFALALPLINLENRRVFDAFGRSARLVRGHAWRVGTIAVGAFLVPEAAVATASLLHTGNVVLDAVVHAIPATVLLPLAALPIVIATFDLVALDGAESG
ncbi:hypothetical protein ACE2AJ_06760 [Aquihabitans daechungensis]|uniref:hypothetical protein n=1 Tax=Aquihabitans daechungensis TaxID=1052257 RepID=UPI003BA0BE8F